MLTAKTTFHSCIYKYKLKLRLKIQKPLVDTVFVAPVLHQPTCIGITRLRHAVNTTYTDVGSADIAGAYMEVFTATFRQAAAIQVSAPNTIVDLLCY